MLMELEDMMRAIAVFSFLLLFSGVAFCQTGDAPASAPAKFEIADVHVSAHVTTNVFFSGAVFSGGRYVMRNATMLDLITTAYGYDDRNVVSGPSWLESTRFDVIAKAPPTTSEETLNLMLQALLVDRFKLVVRPDTRPMPVFALTLGKGKPKLKEADGTGESGCRQNTSQPNGTASNAFTCTNMTADDIAKEVLPRAGAYLPNPVVDLTGLKGSWNFDIAWTPRGALAQAGPDGVSVFDAVDKQLGLKLEAQKIPMPVLVVESVNEKPTDNPAGVEKSLPPAPPAQFEVALIKPSAPGATSNGRMIDGGQVNLQAITLKELITIAWGLNPRDTEALAGAPKWLDSDKFDIIAKTSTEVPSGPAGTVGNPQIDFESVQLMLRALLIDRFKMQVHTETRLVNGFVLLTANPKMKKADPANRTECKNGPGPDGKDPRLTNPILSRLISCQNMTMAQFAEKLPSIAGGYIFGEVLNSTGLEGAWDFTLNFSPAGVVNGGGGGRGGRGGDSVQTPAGDLPAADPSGALSLFDAISKQLGLKLDKQKRPMPVLVIDHVEEKPTDN
jgi:uncharacterized protein (TIGR03435 family)